jgi:two-component system OmpR family sensor kinase
MRLFPTTLTLRARLTWWYGLVLVVVLGVSGVAVVWMNGRLGVNRVDGQLADVEATVLKILTNELREQVLPPAAAAEASETVSDRNVAVAISDAHGATLASSLPGRDLFRTRALAQEPMVSTVYTSTGTWRLRAHRDQVDGTAFVVVVAISLSDLAREQGELRKAMLIGMPIVLLLAGMGGWWLASIGLAPLTAMTQRAARLPLSGSEDLGEASRPDEIGELTRAFNGLVARLRAALETQRRFMADASHELRTPMSIIRSAADVALSRDRRSHQEYREALAIVGDQSRRVGRLVEDMLVLARADAGGYPLHVVNLDLGEVVADCRRALATLASERSVQIRSEEGSDVPLRGDEDLLRRLVQNLLHNAIQHTPPGGIVAVSVASEPGGATIRVSDGGSGIPEDDRARIFDRFVRLDEERGGNGTGLGLPIARWIVEAHGGTLILEASGPRGSTFCATLTAPADSHPSPPRSRDVTQFLQSR